MRLLSSFPMPSPPTDSVAPESAQGASPPAWICPTGRGRSERAGNSWPGQGRHGPELAACSIRDRHIAQIGCDRWLASSTSEDRADNEAWVREFLDAVQ